MFAFAGPLGIAVGVTGCTGVCMVACATAAFVPPACFANDTYLHVVSPTPNANLPISEVQAGDYVVTLASDNTQRITKVVKNLRTAGRVDIFEFTASYANGTPASALKVTPNHGVLILRDNNLLLSLPTNIRPGDVFVSSRGPLVVTNITKSVAEERFTLISTEGTVLASDVLVSTLCDEEIVPGKKLNDVLPSWRLRHQYAQ